MENLIAAVLREFSLKVGRFLHEAFSLNLAWEAQKERSLLLVSLLRNNFGQKVGDDLLNEWLPAGSASVFRDPILQPCVLPASPGPIIDVAMSTVEPEKESLQQ